MGLQLNPTESQDVKFADMKFQVLYKVVSAGTNYAKLKLYLDTLVMKTAAGTLLNFTAETVSGHSPTILRGQLEDYRFARLKDGDTFTYTATSPEFSSAKPAGLPADPDDEDEDVEDDDE